MDEFNSNTEAQTGPEVFAAQAGFACAAPGRSHSRRMARPIKPMNIPAILNVHWYKDPEGVGAVSPPHTNQKKSKGFAIRGGVDTAATPKKSALMGKTP